LIAIDTNILVYAHRKDSAWHDAAWVRIQELAEGRPSWGLPWPCLHEFFAIVTHPRIYSPPSKPAEAIAQIETWLESPSLSLLAETSDYWPTLKSSLESSLAAGPQVHDARIVALCRLHGVQELWTADRDFSRFMGLKTLNPLLP
jgi:toxin-antitoxin system PIN domain toxin